jgi:tRNA(adenine34) deaminase
MSGTETILPVQPASVAGAVLDELMMARALELAREARNLGEVPVGAVVARDGRILSQAFNLRETLHDPTAHAERLALTWAGRSLGSWRLEDCVLYVTLEPCAMCAGAIVQSRLARLVYGAADPKAGACVSLYRLVSDPRLNHQATITAGVMAHQCGEVLKEFFEERRAAISGSGGKNRKTAFSPEKPGGSIVSVAGGAEAEAPKIGQRGVGNLTESANECANRGANLETVIRAWGRLPDAVREGILAWDRLPEAIRAGLVAMFNAAKPD